MLRLIQTAVVITAATLAASTMGQEPQAAPDEASLAAARSLGYEGVAAYKAGDYSTATQKLRRAFGIVRVPTLGLWFARALVQEGRFVEAAERYEEVARLATTEGEVEAQQEAKETAAQERLALMPRIPTVRITVEGALLDDVTITVNGVAVSRAALTAPVLVDPTPQRIQGKRGEVVVTEELTPKVGERHAVTLRFPQAVASSSPSEPAAAEAQQAQSPPPSSSLSEQPASVPPDRPAPGAVQRTGGWAAVGVGGAGVIAGLVTGLVAISKRDSLGEDCPNDVCPPSRRSDVDLINTLRNVSTVSFIIGGLAGATGAALLLTIDDEQDSGTAAGLWLGVGVGGVAGRF